MILKVAIPGKMHFKMIHRDNLFLGRTGEIHYIGGAEVLPPPGAGKGKSGYFGFGDGI